MKNKKISVVFNINMRKYEDFFQRQRRLKFERKMRKIGTAIMWGFIIGGVLFLMGVKLCSGRFGDWQSPSTHRRCSSALCPDNGTRTAFGACPERSQRIAPQRCPTLRLSIKILSHQFLPAVVGFSIDKYKSWLNTHLGVNLSLSYLTQPINISTL